MALNFLLKRSGTASKRPTAANMALGELDLNYDAATGGLYYKDSNGNVVKVGPTQVSATAPNVSPAGSAGNSTGECWFDTASQVLKVWTGSSWVDATSTDGFLPLTGGTMTGDITFSGTQSIPVSGIDGASTTQPGVVQLNDTTSSTSTTEALTANQGYLLQQQIDALSVASNITLAGTIDASTSDLVTVTTEGTAAGFAVGDPLPSAAPGNDNFFVIVTTPGTMTPPGGVSQECHQGDWWLSDGTEWVFLDVGFNATAATTSTPGVVQLATDAEVQAGLNSDHAVTSSGLQSKVSDSTSTTSSTALASSTAVKSAYDAGIQGQTDAAAALAAANAAGTDVGTLASLTTTDKTSAVAAINEVNAAASAAQGDATQAISDASAAQATADAAVPDASYTALGDILSGTGAGTYSALPVGTDGQVLTACSACSSGLTWGASGGGSSPTTLYSGSGTTTAEQLGLPIGSWPAGSAGPAPGALSALIMVSVCNSSGAIVDWANIQVNASGPLPGSNGQYVAYLANKYSTVSAGGTSSFYLTGDNYPDFNNIAITWTSPAAGTYCYNLAITQYGGNTNFTVA